ncbi:anthranilate synthase component II [Mongoliitalea daihaiensis]|uniref:anthranilate synthase component II n=1 Tax=Mongoliitalea daihaiensis TaxID=2782006 RepID=UPI001F3BDE59|nr:aminodeoxychorismate/anthranilate synthase component II [Mongoliitalea daihaiensis]UJP66298.1 aminodeoxychorismate/anthranilate synthase component II [Mongoliitalea daihaiensis]
MVLLIDNFDSFSHMLADYFLRFGVEIKIYRNDVSLEELKQHRWEALILSPGPETPDKAGNLMGILEYYHDQLPVLGICLGHQAIGQFFGASLIKGQMPIHGKVHTVYKKNEHPILLDLPDQFEVTRYHSLELINLPSCLKPLLLTKSGVLMGLAHQSLPIIGIQYHPEAVLTEYGEEIIENFLELTGLFTAEKVCL